MLHTLAHYVIFIACLVATVEVSRSFVSLIRLRWKTRIAAKLFFLSCGLTQLGLALKKEDAFFFTLTDFVQAGSIVLFLLWLAFDLRRALHRLRLAFKVIQAEYGADGDRMIATVITALQRRGS